MLLSHWGYGILTQFHPFPPVFTLFCSFPPHPLFSRVISPHHRDAKKAEVQLHTLVSMPFVVSVQSGEEPFLISSHLGGQARIGRPKIPLGSGSIEASPIIRHKDATKAHEYHVR